MKLERSQPEDAPECVDWMMQNLDLNDCSPRTLKGSTFYKIAGILYLPVKPVLMLESLAPNPSVTGTKRLLALRRAAMDLQEMYPNVEILFLTRKDARLAECSKRVGFEEVPFACFRLPASKPDRGRKKEAEKGVSQARIQDDPGGSGQKDSCSEGLVRDMPESVHRGA